MVGEITGMRTTELSFSYIPKTFATAEAEITIRTTEFDSEPKTIRIVGNAAPAKDSERRMLGGPSQNQTVSVMDQSIVDNTKTLLTGTKSFNPQVRLKKIGKSDHEKSGDQTGDELAKPQIELKSVKLSDEE